MDLEKDQLLFWNRLPERYFLIYLLQGKTLSAICGSLNWLTTEGYKPIEEEKENEPVKEPIDFIERFKIENEKKERERMFQEEQEKVFIRINIS